VSRDADPLSRNGDCRGTALGDEAVEKGWAGTSVLPDFKVSGLAGHLARSVLQVEWYLDAELGNGQPITAAEYYAALAGVADPDSELNRAVRQRAKEVAVGGHRGRRAHGRRAGTTAGAPAAEPGERRVEALGRVLLDEYLKTRLVELTVHMDDLALSVGVSTPREPAEAYTVAIETLVRVATRRNGPLIVLRALSRAERQGADVLRVL
jgi:hypothetical protein